MGQGGAAPPDPTFSHKVAGDSKVICPAKREWLFESCERVCLCVCVCARVCVCVCVCACVRACDETDPSLSHKAAGDSKVLNRLFGLCERVCVCVCVCV